MKFINRYIDFLISASSTFGQVNSSFGVSVLNYGIKSEGILSLNINNCITDLCEERAIDTSNTVGLLVSNVLDKATQLNIIKDSNFKMPNRANSFIVDKGLTTKISVI